MTDMHKKQLEQRLFEVHRKKTEIKLKKSWWNEGLRGYLHTSWEKNIIIMVK